jgi:Leucine-rich repeat (LRR) protein
MYSRKRKVFKSLLMVFLGVLSIVVYPISSNYEVLYSYNGISTSDEDGLQLTNFKILGPSPWKSGDTVTVEFDLTNITRKTIYFGRRGIFVGCLNPRGGKEDFGHQFKKKSLLKGKTVRFKASKKLDKKGTWTFWPSYYLGSASWVNHRSGYGPYKWQAAKIKPSTKPVIKSKTIQKRIEKLPPRQNEPVLKLPPEFENKKHVNASKEKVLHYYEGSSTAKRDGLELTNFKILGPSPWKAGDTVTIEFDLKNITRKPIFFGKRGIFVGCINPNGGKENFGHQYKKFRLPGGKSVHFKTIKRLGKKGTWTFWPTYYLGSDGWGIHRSGYGLYKWQAVKIKPSTKPVIKFRTAKNGVDKPAPPATGEKQKLHTEVSTSALAPPVEFENNNFVSDIDITKPYEDLNLTPGIDITDPYEDLRIAPGLEPVLEYFLPFDPSALSGSDPPPCDCIFQDTNVSKQVIKDTPFDMLRKNRKATEPLCKNLLIGIVEVDLNFAVQSLTGLECLESLQKIEIGSSVARAKIRDLTPLAGLMNLEEIKIHNKYDLDVSVLSGIKSLKKLKITHSPISQIRGLSSLTSVEFLRIRSTNISSIDSLGNLTNLSVLWLHDNRISNIEPLRDLNNLEVLLLSKNRVSNIEPLRDLKNLETLYLEENQVSNIEPLRDLKNLKTLYLEENQVSNIEPLRDLKNLEILNLSRNRVSNIEPLNGLTNLKVLYLKDNMIKTIGSLVCNMGINNSDFVYLEGNSLLDCDGTTSTKSQLQTLKNRGVRLDIEPNSLREADCSDTKEATMRLNCKYGCNGDLFSGDVFYEGSYSIPGGWKIHKVKNLSQYFSLVITGYGNLRAGQSTSNWRGRTGELYIGSYIRCAPIIGRNCGDRIPRVLYLEITIRR